MDNLSNELAELCTWDNLLQRSRISDQGDLARKAAAKGNVYMARQWAMQATHDARLLFPDLFLWQEEVRYGQQLRMLFGRVA